MMGSKLVVHWTSETWWEWSEIAGSPQGFPPAVDSRRVTCSERETGTGKLCEIKWDYHTRPSDSSGQGLPQTRPQWSITSGHQCSKTTLTGESQFHISTPCGSKRVVHWTSETWWEWSEIAGSLYILINAKLVSFVWMDSEVINNMGFLWYTYMNLKMINTLLNDDYVVS